MPALCSPKRPPFIALLAWCGAVAVLFFLVIPPIAVAQQQSPAACVFRLQPMQKGCQLDISIESKEREVEFQKEPEYKGSDIVRGALGAREDSKAFTGFAYDKAGDTLYIDENRNLDLTDDPEGIFKKKDSFLDEFEDVRVPVPGSTAFALLNVDFYGWFSDATVMSGWQAEIELNGQKSHLVVIDNLDGIIDNEDVLVITDDPKSLAGCTEDPHPNRLPVPKRLWLKGAAYDLSFAFEGTDLLATFTQASVPTGELTLDGAMISRLVLQASKVDDKGSTAVIIDNPGKSIAIPAEAYNLQEIYLKGGNPPGIFHASCEKTLTITPGKPAQFKAGGPLTNQLSTERSGRTFTFDYKLKGVADEEYQELAPPSPMEDATPARGRGESVPPTVLISLNGEQIASGKFEYG